MERGETSTQQVGKEEGEGLSKRAPCLKLWRGRKQASKTLWVKKETEDGYPRKKAGLNDYMV